jgi:hypothetical protein
LEAAGLVALPLALLAAPVAEFIPPAAGFVALIPGPLGMSAPAGPGTELPTEPEPPAPIPPLLPPAAPLPIPPPAPPAPAPPPAPCANAFAPNVDIASAKVAPNSIVDKFLFIVVSPWISSRRERAAFKCCRDATTETPCSHRDRSGNRSRLRRACRLRTHSSNTAALLPLRMSNVRVGISCCHLGHWLELKLIQDDRCNSSAIPLGSI